MSKRRIHQEKAWIVINETIKRGTILTQSNPWECTKSCGDEGCIEVHKVEFEDGTERFHVSECVIFDSYEEASSSLKEDDCQSPY